MARSQEEIQNDINAALAASKGEWTSELNALAATTVIGGGQETSVSFSIDSLVVGDGYTFFCSFPGHYAIMKGAFKVI